MRSFRVPARVLRRCAIATRVGFGVAATTGIQEVMIGEICWIEGMRNDSRVALRDPERLIIFRRRLASARSSDRLTLAMTAPGADEVRSADLSPRRIRGSAGL